MQKHAYLILAHNNSGYLQTLVECLDNPLNDIFIHWDAKSGSLPDVSAKESTVRFTSKRIPVHWGDFSVVEAEYALFKESSIHGPYRYYHLISGLDIPIKTQEEIHRICDLHPGIEYIGFAKSSEKEINWRVNHFFLFPKRFQSAGKWVRAIRWTANAAQDMVGFHRQQGLFKKGAQWVSVTESFVDYLLSNEGYVRKRFRRTFCPDEMYKQTLCWNSEFKERLTGTDDEFEGCRRFIKWEKGCLLPIGKEDIPTMIDSERWFARKISPDDRETIDLIISSIK